MRAIPVIRELSRYDIKPKIIKEEAPQTCNLTPWGVSLLSVNYGQLGLLFSKPLPNLPMHELVDKLRESLSCTLTHFPHLAGRLKTEICGDKPPTYSVSVNCTNLPGAMFISARAKDVSVTDITSPDNPNLVYSLFAFRREIAYDAHSIPLLGVQVTELLDGLFISCSINHAIIDGTSFWHFLRSWSEISSKMLRSSTPRFDDDYVYEISESPIVNRNWVMEKYGQVIKLPYRYYSEIPRHAPPPPPPLWDRIFHISAKSIARLKAQANANPSSGNNISSFQAFNAFLWRCVTRARSLSLDQETSCLLTVDDRYKLHPPLSPQDFGCHVQCLAGTTTAGELLTNDLGWSAWLLHEAVVGHDSKKVHTFLEDFIENPSAPQYFLDNCLIVEHSPRFEVYKNEFGLGKPLAIRSGDGNKNDGTVFVYEGREGGGAMDVELFLSPESMNVLVSDPEFMHIMTS